MWVDADKVSHTVAIDGGRDRVDPALLSWMDAMKAKDIRLLEDRLDDIQDEIFDAVADLTSVPCGEEGQELPEDVVIGADLDDVSMPHLLAWIRNVDLAWRMDVVELLIDVADELSEAR